MPSFNYSSQPANPLANAGESRTLNLNPLLRAQGRQQQPPQPQETGVPGDPGSMGLNPNSNLSGDAQRVALSFGIDPQVLHDAGYYSVPGSSVPAFAGGMGNWADLRKKYGNPGYGQY